MFIQRSSWLAPLLCLAVSLGAAAPAAAQNPENRTYATTDGPIVLVAGLMAFNSLGFSVASGLGECTHGFQYWGAIPDELEGRGATVYCFAATPVQSNAARGRELVYFLEQLSVMHPGKRFNLMGHSQGSPTSRFAAHHRPDLVASVTSIGGVNGGSHAADFLLEHLGASPAELDWSNPLKVVAHHLAIMAAGTLGDLISMLDTPESFAEIVHDGSQQNAYGAITSLSTLGSLEFGAPCAPGKSEWMDGCNIGEGLPSYLANQTQTVACTATGTAPAGHTPGAHVVSVPVSPHSPGVPANRVGQHYDVRYYSWTGNRVNTSETFTIWFGWPWAGMIINTIQALPSSIRQLFPYRRGLAGDAWFDFQKDPSDYLMGIGSITALENRQDLYSYTIPTDGLVQPCSAHLGWMIRDTYNMNHLDESDLFGDGAFFVSGRPSAGVAQGGTQQVRSDINETCVRKCFFTCWYECTALAETNPPTLLKLQANRLREAGL